MATLSRQCWLFAIGSTLFAIATLPGMSAVAGAGLANVLCFVGSWFFTTAGWMQLVLSGPALRIGWLAEAQSAVLSVESSMTDGLSPTARRQLISSLTRCAENLELG